MGLEEQVAELTARVAELERRLLPPPPPDLPTPPGSRADLPPPPPPPFEQAGASGPRRIGDRGPLVAQRPWMNTETLLKWSGLVLVVLAAVFFVGTAISRGWIGPEMQLAGATIGGLLLIGGGFRLIETNRGWASALAAGGAAVVAVCAAASNAGLDLLSEYPALVVLAIVTLGLAEVSRRLSVELVATVSGLAAAVLPLWIITDADVPPLVPAGWMAVLAVAATAFGWIRGWTAARLLTVGVSGLVLLGLAADSDALATSEKTIAVIAIVVVAVAGWAGPAYPALRGPTVGDRWRAVDHRSALAVPAWTWILSVLVVDLDGDRSVAALGLATAAAFTAAAIAVWRRLPLTLATAHVLGAGILVAISMAVLVDGPGLLVALAVQAAATAVLARMFNDRLLSALAILLGAIAIAWAAGSTLAGVFEREPTGQLLADLLVIGLLIGWAVDSWWRANEQLTVPLVLVSWIGVLGWIAAAFGHRPQGQVIVSLLWSAMAAAALVLGVRSNVRLSRALGIVTLVVVLLKLLSVDLAEVDTFWRVGLFLVVGTGLLRLGYVLPRLSTGEGSQLR